MPINLEAEDVLRFPLVGSLSTRLFESGSLESAASGIVGIGIVGIMIVGGGGVGGGVLQKDQHFVNCWPDKITDPGTGQSKFYVNKRPGFQANTTPASGNIGTAIHVWGGKGAGVDLISAFGPTNSTIYLNTTSLGAVTGLVSHISDTLVGTTPTVLLTSSGNEGYYYPDGGALTNITDADFPANIASTSITGGFVSLGGYNFIMTTSGLIYNSDLNSIANWTSTSFLSAGIKPDAGVGLARYKHYIVAFGKESMEFFQNQANLAGSPLASVAQLAINIGAVNQHCYKEIDDTLAWIGTSAQGRIGVYLLDGFSPKKISTPLIDGLLTLIPGENLVLNTVVLTGKTFLVIVSNANARTFVYCLDDGYWHEWSSTTILWSHIAGLSASVKNVYAVSRVSTSGKIYIINPTAFVFTDDSQQYPVTIQTLKMDGGTNRRKFGGKLWLVGDTYTSSNPILISWSDDDYQTFSTARTLDLANNNPYLSAIGSFRRRIFKLSQTSDLPLRLEAIEIPIKLGLH